MGEVGVGGGVGVETGTVGTFYPAGTCVSQAKARETDDIVSAGK